ncbi:hypothetical protein [Paraburkholderia sp. GAS42]|jgi:hypothetical protein|uniref:hypothetical protein n=1 Tax=Paraburkholderia sp. GAS42 TaxID=3035135 RepID=UPI003D1DDB43
MKDAYERRALLLHLGDVLEAIQDVLHRRRDEPAVRELVAAHHSLARFPLLTQISPQMPVQEFVERSTRAFASWPQALLEEDLNRAQLALAVRRSLFAGNPAGWRAYAATLRTEVAWFGKNLPLVEDEGKGEAAVQTDTGDDEPANDVEEGAVEVPGGDERPGAADVERGDVEQQRAGQKGVENVESGGRIYPSWPWKSEG